MNCRKLLPGRRELVAARRQAREYAQYTKDAELRLELAKAQAVRAGQSDEELREQIRRNGWTDMLQSAWGRRQM